MLLFTVRREQLDISNGRNCRIRLLCPIVLLRILNTTTNRIDYVRGVMTIKYSETKRLEPNFNENTRFAVNRKTKNANRIEIPVTHTLKKAFRNE